jgi:hypothetical protein
MGGTSARNDERREDGNERSGNVGGRSEEKRGGLLARITSECHDDRTERTRY